MSSAFKIGRAAGIGVRVHWTFFPLLAFFAFSSLDSVIHGYQEDFPVVDEDGNLVGMLTIEDVGHATLIRQQPRK